MQMSLYKMSELDILDVNDWAIDDINTTFNMKKCSQYVNEKGQFTCCSSGESRLFHINNYRLILLGYSSDERTLNWVCEY